MESPHFMSHSIMSLLLLTKCFSLFLLLNLYFQDMAIYSMVKNNTFNGIPLPGIAVMKEDGDCELIRTFGYGDFKGRLA